MSYLLEQIRLIDELKAAIERAEAAEAKLAELEKQKPVAYRWEGKESGNICYDGMKPLGVICQPLFTRPATAAYLNAVRAEGALLVAERMRKARYVFKDMHHGVVSECADIAVDVAKKLRAGDPS